MKNIRIETIADMVKQGMVVADIGTDHAFLPILLIQNHISPKVYACDVAKGPLESAKANIAKAGFSNQITTILSDGLKNVPQDVEICVIAGMGYYTAVQILTAAIDRLPHFQQIIVEVNRNTDKMRQWISDHHYTITDEMAVHEKGYDYIIISFTTQTHEPYTETENIAGTKHLHAHKEAFSIYRDHRLKKIQDILTVSKGQTPNHLELEKEREILENLK